MKQTILTFLLASLCLMAVAQSDNMLSTPLTIEAISDGVVTIDNPRSLTLQYSLNGYSKISVSEENIELYMMEGDKLALYGNNASYSTSSGVSTTIGTTVDSYIYGNVMSLINSTSFSTLKSFSGTYALSRLFSNSAHLKNHPEKQLVLPATSLTLGCYQQMFEGCNGLTSAPELPATTLAVSCYARMFANCIGITSSPELPATSLVDNCYTEMFAGCSRLSTVTCMATGLSANVSPQWLSGVNVCGTFIKNPGYAGVFERSETGAPEGWKLVNKDSNKSMAELSFGQTLITIPYGGTLTTPTLSNANNLDVAYYSSDESVATVDETGIVTVEGGGTTAISAFFSGNSTYYPTTASYLLQVLKLSPDLAFSSDELICQYGEVFAEPSLNNPHNLPVAYTSSDHNVTLVDSSTGKLNLVNDGTAVITATFNGNSMYDAGSASYTVTVIKNSSGIAFEKKIVICSIGEANMEPTLYIENGCDVSYSSSNSEVAEVNETTGVLTIKANGQSTITANFAGNEKYTPASDYYLLNVVDDATSMRYDVNGDGRVSITDAVAVVNYILKGGRPSGSITLTANSGTIMAGGHITISVKSTHGGIIMARATSGDIERIDKISIDGFNINVPVNGFEAGEVVITVSCGPTPNYDLATTNYTLTIIPDPGVCLAQSTVGMKVGSNGKAYDVDAEMPTDVTVIGMIASKGANSGIVISKQEAPACSYHEAINYKVPVEVYVSGLTKPVTLNWFCGSKGSYEGLGFVNNGSTQTTTLNTYLKAAGCSVIGDTWSTTVFNDYAAWHYEYSYWVHHARTFTYPIRPLLSFSFSTQ